MSKIVVFLLLLVFLSILVQAQTSDIIQKLASDLLSADTDEQRATMLLANPDLFSTDLTQALLKGIPKLRSHAEYEKAFQICAIAKQISEKLSDNKGVIDAENMTATLLIPQDEYDEALKKYRESLGLSEQVNYVKGKADALNGIAWIQVIQGDVEDADKNANEALTLNQSMGNEQGIARSLEILGVMSEDSGKEEKALELYQQALKIREHLSDKMDMARSYMSIANVYAINRWDLAERYYEKAAAIIESEGDKRGKAVVYGNLGVLYADQGNRNVALDYQLRSLDASHEIVFRNGEVHALYNIGVIYEEQANYDLSMTYYKQALALAEKIRLKRDACYAMSGMGVTMSLTGKYNEALPQFEKSLPLCNAAGRPESEILEQIGYVYQQTGKYDRAHEYYEKVLKDYEHRKFARYLSFMGKPTVMFLSALMRAKIR